MASTQATAGEGGVVWWWQRTRFEKTSWNRSRALACDVGPAAPLIQALSRDTPPWRGAGPDRLKLTQ
ncbi:hypothetical protein K439DRAFT_1627962 [Ramaria rubella]|nr:hypothetical protein K439DRAFT_1627962 [Ramaria rubella]